MPNVEPGTGPGNQITYDITSGHMIGNTSEWALTCGASVTEGWALSCGDVARLVETKTSTLAPTVVTVAGSGALAGLNAGWQTTYGHPVTVSATVSAQNGSRANWDGHLLRLRTEHCQRGLDALGDPARPAGDGQIGRPRRHCQ